MATIDIDLCSSLDTAVEPSRPSSSAGVRVGELLAIQDGVVPYVMFPGQPGNAAIAARATATLSARDIGREVVLSFVDGDLRHPIVIGCLKDERARPIVDARDDVEIDADGRTLVVAAKDEIVLRCGKASITLTRAGKVLIRGTYVVSRSSGVNCVKGGTVEIN